MNIVEWKIQHIEVDKVEREIKDYDHPAEEKEGDKKIEVDKARVEDMKNSDHPELGKERN